MSKSSSKHPEQFGKGAIEGVAAAEAGNNAVCPAALIPMMAFGIPGDTVTAILLGAFMAQGLIPGPMLFVKHKEIIYGLFAILIMTNVMMLGLGSLAIRYLRKISLVPQSLLSPAIVVMEKAFHGRTLATLSATGNRKVQAGFEPLVGGIVRVPFDDLAAVENIAANNVVAILLEPIQGEGGINVAHPEYLQGLRRICDERGWLLMFDEIQCGLGRTGYWFACQHAGVKPDVMTLAKGLGSGVPIGACLATGPAAGVFKPGNHGSTFGGNPLACTAALTTLSVRKPPAAVKSHSISPAHAFLSQLTYPVPIRILQSETHEVLLPHLLDVLGAAILGDRADRSRMAAERLTQAAARRQRWPGRP